MTAEARPIAGEPNNKQRQIFNVPVLAYCKAGEAAGEKFRRSSKFGDKLDSSTSEQ